MPVAGESRVKNITTLFIVKADQAKAENETDLPTALVVM